MFHRWFICRANIGVVSSFFKVEHRGRVFILHIMPKSVNNEDTTPLSYEFHKQMDKTVLNAYGWQDINLVHDFYKVDYLPENDRVRYTISPDARKEVLKHLLKLNHEIHEQEAKASLHAKGKTKKKQKADASEQMKLF